MFTILIRHKGGTIDGHEVAEEARSYTYDPVKKELFLEQGFGFGRSVSFDNAEQESEWRDVFVMNATGATVARYTL